MESHKSHVPNHQPVIYHYWIWLILIPLLGSSGSSGSRCWDPPLPKVLRRVVYSATLRSSLACEVHGPQHVGIHRGELTEDPRKDMENSMEMTQPLSFIISSHIKKGKFQLAGWLRSIFGVPEIYHDLPMLWIHISKFRTWRICSSTSMRSALCLGLLHNLWWTCTKRMCFGSLNSRLTAVLSPGHRCDKAPPPASQPQNMQNMAA
jgi:hypothetical protein